MKKIALPALVGLALVFIVSPGFAQNIIPRPDSTFNAYGKTPLDYFASFEPGDLSLQADGKILVCGYGRSTDNDDFDGYMSRLNADGTLDVNFGDNGFLVLDPDGGHDNLTSVKVLPDNKILLLLESAFRAILIKLLPNGNFDTTFGNEGYMFVPTAEFEYSSDMIIQPDGKIIILADKKLPSNRFIGTVRRCNPDGSLDESYGNNGSFDLSIDPSKHFTHLTGTLQVDGKLLITGTFGTLAGSGFPVIRLNTDGSYDNSFSDDGINIRIMGNSINSATAESIAVDPNGIIYVGGAAPSITGVDLAVLSMTSTGGTNGSFGTFGISRTTVMPLYASARTIIIQSDGKILAGGYTYSSPSTTRFAFVRLNANGTPDMSFGNANGRFVDSIDVDYDVQIIQDMELQPDGRLLGVAWLNETINLTAPDNYATCFVLRYITDIAVKAEEPSEIFRTVSVSPNPVGEEEISLKYTLERSGNTSIHLYNAKGLELATLIHPIAQSSGEHTLHFVLPPKTNAGTYFLVLSTDSAQKVVKILKL
ncbi:MAG: T9SS type A sorting domain-containing protein [Saprospiraceae bacterium]